MALCTMSPAMRVALSRQARDMIVVVDAAEGAPQQEEAQDGKRVVVAEVHECATRDGHQAQSQQEDRRCAEGDRATLLVEPCPDKKRNDERIHREQGDEDSTGRDSNSRQRRRSRLSSASDEASTDRW